MTTESTGVRPPDLRTRIIANLKKPLYRPVFFRLGARLQKRRPDLEIAQLTALRQAYASGAGPDVLLFGDSAMFWTRPGETDLRKLGDIVDDELGGAVRTHTIVGAGLNSRMVLAYLHALEGCASRPRVVVVPTSVMMASSGWLTHPVLSYEIESAALRKIAAAGQPYPKNLPRSSEQDWDKYDRSPAHSLSGAKRTHGEIRMIINAIPASKVGLPTTKWQQLVRVRHLLELSNAERLEPESVGVSLVGDVATMLKEMGVPSVAYIAPINVDVIGKIWGPAAVEHVVRNATLVETAYRERGGSSADVINAARGTPAAEFSDPLHLNEPGRLRFAARLVAGIQRSLEAIP
jgi:hypothetical protein